MRERIWLRLKPKKALSLKGAVTLTIALTAFIPNALLSVWVYRTVVEWTEFLPLMGWIIAVGIFSVALAYLLTHLLLRSMSELEHDLSHMRIAELPITKLRLPPPEIAPPREVLELRSQINQILGQLRDVSETREALYATLAHDLKTPLLAAVRAVAYIEQEDSLGKEARKAVLIQLRDELARSYQLVENLLAVSRLETAPLSPENLSGYTLAQNLKLRYQDDAARYNIDIEIDPRGPGDFWVDRGLIERALGNLIENAFRYAKTRIVLRIGTGWLEVEDDGPGLPASVEQLSRPFKSQRLRGVRSGTAGLGMYIALQVARAHGGDLTNRRGSLGGACLKLALPRSQPFADGLSASPREIK